MTEIDVNALFGALRPENLKRQLRENNGKASIKLADCAKSPDADK